jgi:hypothetical protein
LNTNMYARSALHQTDLSTLCGLPHVQVDWKLRWRVTRVWRPQTPLWDCLSCELASFLDGVCPPFLISTCFKCARLHVSMTCISPRMISVDFWHRWYSATSTSHRSSTCVAGHAQVHDVQSTRSAQAWIGNLLAMCCARLHRTFPSHSPKNKHNNKWIQEGIDSLCCLSIRECACVYAIGGSSGENI